MNANKIATDLLAVVQGFIALAALILGGFALWKLSFSFGNVDAKTAAEIAACFAITAYCLKGS
jgi:hypothetical protein